MPEWNDPDIVTRAQLSYQRLQLPIPTSEAEKGLNVLWQTYVESFDGAEPEDCLIAFEADVTEWLEGLKITDRLKSSLLIAISNAAPNLQENHKIDYPSFITDLANSYALLPQDAVKLGSQLSLVKTLAKGFQYSSSSINAILESKVEVEKLNTYLLQDMGKFVGSLPSIDENDLSKIVENDILLSPTIFADSELEDIVEKLNITAKTLNMPRIGDYFAKLIDHDPYLQMLHWQSVLIEFQDFDPSILYEFAPRGKIAKTFFKQHEAVGVGTGGNPILNNAKSAYAADTQWAMQKKPRHRKSAIGLSDILLSLKTQSYPSRKSMATLLRWAIHKYLDVKSNVDQKLIPNLADLKSETATDRIQSWLKFTAKANTETRGIFEQRCVDYLVSCLFQNKDVEIRGLKDSVNATNLSRLKFGDEEVMDVHSKSVKAYEPHGGNLSQIYIDEHLRSMAKVVLARRQELEMVAPLINWEFKVIFVAHSSSVKSQEHFVSGAKVSVEVSNYSDLIDEVENVGHSPEFFDDMVVSALNRAGVSLTTRTKAFDILT